MRPLIALLCLAGCAEAPETPAEPALRPVVVATCPQGARPPQAPPAPRTVESIARYATAVEKARAQTEAARAVCARRLAEAVEALGR